VLFRLVDEVAVLRPQVDLESYRLHTSPPLDAEKRSEAVIANTTRTGRSKCSRV